MTTQTDFTGKTCVTFWIKCIKWRQKHWTLICVSKICQ